MTAPLTMVVSHVAEECALPAAAPASRPVPFASGPVSVGPFGRVGLP